MRKSIILIFSFLFVVTVYSQDANDLLTFDEYIDIVKKNHPVMYQAELRSDMIQSTRKMARGGFDPKLEADWNHKSFDDKNYYSLANGALKIPTWYGIDVKAGYERNEGQFLNESDLLPARGLWNAGISVPLGKGLVIDERRAALQRADIYESATQQEQLIMTNEILFNAALAYLQWQTVQEYLVIAIDGVELANQRLDGTRSSFVNGDKPAIDTLESFISLQTREMDRLKASQDLLNAKIRLENFLWIEGEVPLEVNDNVMPEPINIQLLQYQFDSISLLQDQRLIAHPELLLYDYKIANIDIDQRLAKEEIKPDIRINYNPLLAVANDGPFDSFNANDYKLGASISYPILQRKQRGKIELNKLKLQDTEFDRSLKSQELKVKLDTYINNMNQALRQYDLQTLTLDNYNRMLIAENRKLEAGESSIFLVNSRESKYLESRYKQIDVGRKLIYNKFTYFLYSIAMQEVL